MDIWKYNISRKIYMYIWLCMNVNNYIDDIYSFFFCIKILRIKQYSESFAMNSLFFMKFTLNNKYKFLKIFK